MDGFIDALARSGSHVRFIHLVTAEDRAFTHARHRLLEALPPFIDTMEETRAAVAGFSADLAYFRLDYLDPDSLELGARFNDLLPTLWLMAGALGPLPIARGDEDFLFPDGGRFAVLLDEDAFRRFNETLSARADIDWVFLTTDSREAFVEMAEQLPPTLPPSQRIHLYRAYLDNFRINLAGAEA